MTEVAAPAEILIVAATREELCGRDGLVCGIGPVEAAAATAAALARGLPACVLHVGLAGARGLALGTVVVGRAAVYTDLEAAIAVVEEARPESDLLARACAALPGARELVIATSARVGATDAVASDVLVEAMEGFGVLRACALAGVPALEVRAVSNEVGEPDRQRWDVSGALRALATALERLLPALAA